MGKVRGRREAGGQCPLLAAGMLGDWGSRDWAVREGGRRGKGSVGSVQALGAGNVLRTTGLDGSYLA